MASVFSYLLLLATVIYLFWGSYIMWLRPKVRANQVFLLVCISLSIWSFGLAAANTSQTLDSALGWRRFSAIGWTTFHSAILHFILLLTATNEAVKCKKRWLLLYIPALMSTYIYALSNNLAVAQYNLIKTDLGWIDVVVNNKYYLFYKGYYMIFAISSLVTLWQSKNKFENKKIKKQVKLIVIGFFMALVLGIVLDKLANMTLGTPIPRIAPLFLLIPMGILYYSGRYDGLIEQQVVKKDEIIVTDYEQRMIFYSVSLTFIIGGLIAFLAEYIPLLDGGKGNIRLGILRGSFMVITGIGIYLIQAIKKEAIKEFLTIVVLLISIPVITLQFLDYYTVTVWALPIIIIISSLLFSKRTLLLSTTIMGLVTQRIAWLLRPQGLTYVDQYSYIGRMWLLIVACLIGLYVNKIYVAKLKENLYQLAFQTMISDLSVNFVTINRENFHVEVERLLGEIGEFFKVDRAYLFSINQTEQGMSYSSEWCRSGIEPEIGIIKEMPRDVFAMWLKGLETNQIICIEDVSRLRRETKDHYHQLINPNLKSVMIMPVMADGKVEGLIGMDSVQALKRWSKEDIKRLNIMVNLVASGIGQVKSDREIEFMAYYDQLTKLPNRFLFKNQVNKATEDLLGTSESISIIFIDLDNFKVINDTMGHNSGDYLLQEVGKRLTAQVGKEDLVARFGGDEFMILLNNIKDSNEVKRIAEKVMEIFIEPFIINNQEFIVTGSAGVSIYPVDGEEADELIKNADTAMYQAKFKGKNQYALCTNHMKEKVQNDVALSNDLHKALDNNELLVYYQPQIDLSTGAISGVEALLRWVHPSRGMIPPGIFIPLAEKSNLINGIGEWVLKEAIAQTKRWQDMGLGHIPVAVNLSGMQFINPNLAEKVGLILKQTGLDPKYLELEITEGIAIKEENNALETLNKLKAIGITIAIDDFGTEYSSLNRLKMLPIDRIKIDMQFIQGIEKNKKDQAITMVIINLAKSLGLNVLAEGVETVPQLEFLTQKMCDYVQGYYYYKPMPAQELEKILADL